VRNTPSVHWWSPGRTSSTRDARGGT
jgi:hypothetical protein